MAEHQGQIKYTTGSPARQMDVWTVSHALLVFFLTSCSRCFILLVSSILRTFLSPLCNLFSYSFPPSPPSLPPLSRQFSSANPQSPLCSLRFPAFFSFFSGLFSRPLPSYHSLSSVLPLVAFSLTHTQTHITPPLLPCLQLPLPPLCLRSLVSSHCYLLSQLNGFLP